MLVDEDDLYSRFQRRSESIEMRIAVLGDVCTTDDSSVTLGAVVDVSFDSKSFAVVGDELTEDGDSSFEGDDEGNCEASSAKVGREDGGEDVLLFRTPSRGLMNAICRFDSDTLADCVGLRTTIPFSSSSIASTG